MSNNLENLRNKISGAGDLRSVVRTMKSVAASNIGQYEKSVRALGDYDRTVELGLSICLRKSGVVSMTQKNNPKGIQNRVGAVVFGSDQGLVGQFNDRIAESAVKTLAVLSSKPQVFAVGERVHAQLINAGLSPIRLFALPSSIRAITPLIGQILIETEGKMTELHLFYNRPLSGAGYEPTHQKLLPLDEAWRKARAELPWQSHNLPEIFGDDTDTLRALIREYLFVSIFRACAESLASENASRLAAMQRADKNIDELLVSLSGKFHRLRQSSIDEELFDVISGFEALSVKKG